MIALIDNYDSFVFNLARYFERLGQRTQVVRNDKTTAEDIAALEPTAIVLSPGPGTPFAAGCSIDVVRHWAGKVPILGVCLGHQAIAAAFATPIVRAAEPIHGRTTAVFHASGSIFAGLPNPLVGCRYHSLVVDRNNLAPCLEVTAWTADGTIMAIRHRQWPIIGLQFHPESILTNVGFELLAAFLKLAGLPLPAKMPTIRSELVDHEACLAMTEAHPP